jgi:hypothetical protein
MRPCFLFQWRRRGRREAGWRRRLVRPATVREEEEGGRLGHEVSWADREAEAQWGGGETAGWKGKKMGYGSAECPDGPAGCRAGWAESEENYFLNKI